MIRVKLLVDTKHGRKDSAVVVDNNEAFGLIDSGKAILSKDMSYHDYKITSNEEQVDGKPFKLRINKRK